MGDLTANFSLAEFLKSQKARELNDPNTPTAQHLRNIMRLLAPGMERVRTICGNRPVTITSGYRNPRVNRAVGGVPNSAHALGYAADFTVAGLTPLQAAKLVRDSSLDFDQLILESGRGVVHISFDPRDRREVLRQPGGPGTTVFRGLE